MLKHGTASKYVRDGCRCDLCKEAKNIVQRRWYAKKRGLPTPEAKMGLREGELLIF